MENDIDVTLENRGKSYGDFLEHARITQNIKAAYRDSPNWYNLPPYMKEALEMNAHKVGRILNGDPNLHDSWHDIEGYIKLVSRELQEVDNARENKAEDTGTTEVRQRRVRR